MTIIIIKRTQEEQRNGKKNKTRSVSEKSEQEAALRLVFREYKGGNDTRHQIRVHSTQPRKEKGRKSFLSSIRLEHFALYLFFVLLVLLERNSLASFYVSFVI